MNFRMSELSKSEKIAVKHLIEYALEENSPFPKVVIKDYLDLYCGYTKEMVLSHKEIAIESLCLHVQTVVKKDKTEEIKNLLLKLIE